MLNLLNANILSFLDADICSSDNAVGQVVALAKMIVKVLQIAIPVGLIIMGTIDMGKSVIAGDEKKIKENQGKFVKRIISAVIVFLIPLIINVVLNFVVQDSNDWVKCWNEASWNGAINPNIDDDSESSSSSDKKSTNTKTKTNKTDKTSTKGGK